MNPIALVSRSRSTAFLVSGIFAVALFAGCDKPAAPSPTSAGAASAPGAAAIAGPGKDEKVCFGCSGLATVPCRARGCVAGKVECPGPCLRLNRGTWIHMNVAGHDPSELWQKFPQAGGGYQAWNHHHVGDVVVIQKGMPVNTGPCKLCGGTTRVDCTTCKGQGKQTCEICGGKKFIPVAWTSSDNPWLNSQPDLIRLKDGRMLLGKVAVSSGDDRGIKTRDGKIIHVNVSDILPKSETNSPSVAPPSSK